MVQLVAQRPTTERKNNLSSLTQFQFKSALPVQALEDNRVRTDSITRPLIQTKSSKQVELSDSSTSVTQLLIDGAGFQATLDEASPLFEAIEAKLDAYQLLGDDERAKKQMLLANLETKIYGFLEANHDFADKAALYELMNNVQREHQRVIRAVVNAGESPEWMNLGEDKPAEFDQLWADIVGGAGNLSVSGQDVIAGMIGQNAEAIAGFQDEMFSALARLISQPKGMQLVQNIMNHSVPVTIIPKTNAANVVMAQINGEDPTISPGVAAPVPAGMGPADLLEASRLSSQNLTNTGAVNVQHTDAAMRPTGAQTFVAVRPGLRDSNVISYDANGDEIASPVFVMLGHELQHAEHNIKGQNTRAIKQLGDKNSDYPNLEELDTIELAETSENAIREEHLLEQRIGHAGGLRL